MRHLFLCTLLCTLATPAIAQTTRSLPQSHGVKRSNQATNAEVLAWESRVMSKDAKVRATAQAAVVRRAARSLPLLRRFLTSNNEALHEQTFEIIRQIGPPAIPLLLELLRHKEVTFRQFAADAFIDLTPDTESIQPALRRALRDKDANVAGDAARALGALREKASPFVKSS